MESFCRTLLVMTTTASVGALCVMVLRLVLKRVPRWILCLLWAAVFLRMVCPVTFSLPVSLIPEPVTQGTYVQQLFPSPAPAQQDSPTPELPAENTPSATPDTVTLPSSAPSLSWSHILFGVWLTGAAVTFLWAVLSYVRLRRRLRESIRLENRLYETDQIKSPFVCGFLRPSIYLPADLSPACRPYVLLHEQAHIRRRDYLTKPLAYAALCLHWFNPLLWLSYRLFCQDIEIACDQSVIRSFRKEDVAGYAEALLEVGKAGTYPSPVPLAFGERPALLRIKHVLDYKHPGHFVALVGVIIALLAGILLLANPGSKGDQLEGIAITQGYTLDHGTPVPLSEELVEQAVSLLKTREPRAYQPLESFTPQDGVVALSGPGTGTVFYLTQQEDGTPALVRVNHDGYSSTRKQAPLEGLETTSAYQSFQSDLTSYCATGRADALYALKTPYVGNAVACMKILEALNVPQVIGPYTISLQTAQEPYGITLHLENPPVFQEEQLWYQKYLDEVSWIFLALVDNAGTFGYTYDTFTHVSHLTPEKMAQCKDLTQEEFRTVYQQYRSQLSALSLPSHTAGHYALKEVLYLRSAPTLGSGEKADAAFLQSLYGTSQFVVTGNLFSVTLVNVLSSAYPQEVQYTDPLFTHAALTASSLPLEEGKTLDLTPYASKEVITVQDKKGQLTPYRLYLLDDQLWLSCWSNPGTAQEQLDYLFRLEPTV